jgi:P-type conjugative transfer protein TrbJ
MLKRYWANTASAVALGIMACSLPIAALAGGAASGGSTEVTQLLNNGQLLDIAAKNAVQITNQMTQITNQVTQITNQLKMYANMIQNTLTLPQQIWGNIARDIQQLQSIVQQGQAIAYSANNLDQLLKQRFQSYQQFQSNLPNATNYAQMYQTWSDTNRDTIQSMLKAANLTAQQFSTEKSTLDTIQLHSKTADGQMKALQVAHEIGMAQIDQFQKLRQLLSQQATMMGTWYASQQAKKDLSQAQHDKFFDADPNAYKTTGGKTMKPEW